MSYCTHTHLTALCPGLPRWAGTRKIKPIWILLKKETVSGSGISWAVCKSAPRSRQITTSAPHRSVFYRPGALPATQPTSSKHWRQCDMSCCVGSKLAMRRRRVSGHDSVDPGITYGRSACWRSGSVPGTSQQPGTHEADGCCCCQWRPAFASLRESSIDSWRRPVLWDTDALPGNNTSCCPTDSE